MKGIGSAKGIGGAEGIGGAKGTDVLKVSVDKVCIVSTVFGLRRSLVVITLAIMLVDSAVTVLLVVSL